MHFLNPIPFYPKPYLMFSTFKQKLLLGVYIFILLSIPVGAYLASQNQTVQSRASEKKDTKLPTVTPKPATPKKELLGSSELAAQSAKPSPTPTPDSSSPTIASSYGPTLSLKVTIEGRPMNNYAAKLFIGIAEGTLTANPKFVLSFSVDAPASGEYTNLSLAGLTPGSSYTALIKGSAQIANAASFTMSPTVTNLNDGQAINLVSGDLNEDNVINSGDLTIAQKAAGSTAKSANWNDNADLNKDGVVNLFDLSIINKNIGKIGTSGAWTSPIPKVATPSAGSQGGYWLWLPK